MATTSRLLCGIAVLLALAACGAIGTSPGHRPLLITLDGRAHSDTIRVDTRRLARLPRQVGVEMAYHPNSSYAAYGAAADSAVTMLSVVQTPFMDGVDASEVTINQGHPRDPGVPDARRPELPDSACRHVSAFFLAGEGPAPRHTAYLRVSSGNEEQTLRVDPRRAVIRARPLLTLDSADLARRGGFRLVIRRPQEVPAHRPMLLLQVMRLRGQLSVHLEPVRFGARIHPITPRAAPPADAEWRLYLLEDPARRWSRCRARPPADEEEYEAVEDVVRRYAEQSIAGRIDSVVALYGVPPLRSAKLRREEREIRLTTGGGMIYSADYILRIRERRGRVRGEVYEWWARSPRPELAGGPYNMEGRDPRPRGCRSPRITAARWVCRLEPPIPIDWTRFAARLDSLAAWRLPPQQDRSSWTDQTALLVASRDRGEYRIADYYGVSERSQFASSRAADEVAGMIGGIFGPRWRIPPDSAGWSKVVPSGSVSIPQGTAFLVRDGTTWQRLWAAFPLRGKVPRAPHPPHIDFAREQLLVIGAGLDKTDCPIAPELTRVEVRRGIRYLLIVERPIRWRETPFRGKWQHTCANDPAPVLIVRIGRSGQTVLADYRSGLVFPQRAPKWARAPAAAK